MEMVGVHGWESELVLNNEGTERSIQEVQSGRSGKSGRVGLEMGGAPTRSTRLMVRHTRSCSIFRLLAARRSVGVVELGSACFRGGGGGARAISHHMAGLATEEAEPFLDAVFTFLSR